MSRFERATTVPLIPLFGVADDVCPALGSAYYGLCGSVLPTLWHLFPEVRSFEAFKWLHLGMISEIKRKTLPAIARAVGLDNPQNLNPFLSAFPWRAAAVRQRQLETILKGLAGRSLSLFMNETGNCQKGHSTDYVKRHDIGNVGQKENSNVVVNAAGGSPCPRDFAQQRYLVCDGGGSGHCPEPD